MSFAIVRSADVPAGRGPHPAASPYDRDLSAPLGIENFGLYEVVLPPGAATEPHDHLADGVEDAYVIVRGSGWLVVDGEDTPLIAGQVVAVTKESRRFVRAGADGCTMIAVCA
jgi:quercetin dioxygenase-like cupin family protein